MSEPATRPGRPARLSLDAILDAAERLAAHGGGSAVTMRAVAGELGVSPMAVYRHVRDKDALLVAVLDRQVAGLARPRLPRDPRGRVLRLFRWLYDELDARPWVVDVLTRGDLYAPRIMPAIEEILAGFVALGLTPQRAVDAYLTCWRFTVGTLVIRHATARTLPTLGRPPVQTQAMQSADPTTLPLLAQTRRYWPRARETFDYRRGLAAVVDGLVASLDA